MKLQGKKLQVINIHRKGIFDMDTMAFCCDNCGRTIVNSATVKDTETGKTYVIGLDCKKTLIDKKHIDFLISTLPEWESKHKVKEYKREQSDLQNVMKYIDNPERYKVTADNSTLYVADLTKKNMFGMDGDTIYCENLGYLFKIGLKDVLQAAVNKKIIQYAY
jgi:hypothetical protein